MEVNKLFGTDGIRGTPGEYPLTDGMIFKIGKGAAKFLLHNPQIREKERPTIIIGNDTRASSYKIETVLASGITSYGVDVLSIGIIPTPGLAFLVSKFQADLGLMISASHNRPEDNGIKFFAHSGHKLTEDEERLMENIVFDSMINLNGHSTDRKGTVFQVKNAPATYMDFLRSTVSNLDLSGLKIVADCGNGAASCIVAELFRKMGADVYSVGDKPDGTNINVGYGVLFPDNMSKMVTEYNADIGFAFDGDGDRLILSNEKGEILDGDHIMAIIGTQLLKQNKLPKKTIVATIMSNWGFEDAIQMAGGRIVRTAVGDKYIMQSMRKHGLGLGGEQSGHIIFLEHTTTGDALVAALQILKIMKETNKALSELSKCMRKIPQTLVNVEVKEKKPLEEIEEISQAIFKSNARLEGNGRLLVRYSGTEPVARVMVEGKNKELIKEIADFVANKIKECLGE
ncbi:phosphoglucosamine mutase [Candidatus Omnitrophota bacterium]